MIFVFNFTSFFPFFPALVFPELWPLFLPVKKKRFVKWWLHHPALIMNHLSAVD